MKAVDVIRGRANERGATLVFFAFFVLFLMGAAALAIDLGMLYVARSEAQRAADAAALAGANVFTQGCGDTNSCDSPTVQTIAAQNAIAAAAANKVLGEPGSVDCSSMSSTSTYNSASCNGIVFTDPPSSNGTEPQISVTVQRTGIQLIFARMFNQRVGTVSAVAVAEADTQASSELCPTPFLIPNCDPNPNNKTPVGANCEGGLASFVKPDPTDSSKTVPSNPGPFDPTPGGSPGVNGEPWTLHYAYPPQTGTGNGSSGTSVAPSQWSMVDLNGTSNSLSQVAADIAACAPTIGCGATLSLHTGNNPQPIDSAVNALIQHKNCNGFSPCGQDGPSIYTQDYLLNMQPVPAGNYDSADGGQYPTSYNYTGSSSIDCTWQQAFPFHGGTWNTYLPNYVNCATAGASKSIIKAPVYDGNQLASGCSAGCSVTVKGWVVLFLDYSVFTSGSETVQANILNVIGCGSTTGPSATGAAPVPIRLIQRSN